ncbi:MAG: hypothetical protein WAU96_15845 [Anaerolineae bacterium]
MDTLKRIDEQIEKCRGSFGKTPTAIVLGTQAMADFETALLGLPRIRPHVSFRAERSYLDIPVIAASASSPVDSVAVVIPL